MNLTRILLAAGVATTFALSACSPSASGGGGRVTGVTGPGTTTTIPPGSGATGTAATGAPASAPRR